MALSLLAVYCILIVTASVLGGWLPVMVRMTHLRTQLMMSFVAGLMLGIAMIHMLPHASELLGSSLKASYATLGGVVAMFILLRAFHAHSHGEGDPSPTNADQHDHDHSHQHADGHTHDHHSHDHGHSHGHEHGKELGWIGMLFGLGLHTLMDGVALSASVVAETFHNPWLGLAGLGTFLAVVLHKPLDAFAITSVMRKGGWTPGQLSFVNMTFSLACPIGALLFFFGTQSLGQSDAILGYGLAISAGFFICISLSDLLPEVAFHDHDRLKLTTALFLGIALAITIENLPGHSHEEHGHEQGPTPTVQDLMQ